MSAGSSFDQYDVIVCGAGHAGIEASLAASRMGCRTLLLSGNLDTIGQMSCNPAIGGVAKGHLVREIDALGGEMAINTDMTGIQFRLLNSSRGPAVQSPRAQCDKKSYQLRIKHTVETQSNLQVFQATVTELLVDAGRVVGCRTSLDIVFRGRAVVITTGTFLRGLIHIGSNKHEGGRMADSSAKTLSGSLMNAGIVLERLKTGTPPRLLGASIDFRKMIEQKGDESPTFFAFHDTRRDQDLFHVERTGEDRLGWLPGERQVSCWITHTSPLSERIVRENLHKSAMYSGEIAGVGPRYCPSIEDKFVRFADKERHMLFLEPEGRHTNEFYINGLSTSLPFDVQVDLVQSIPGLESAAIARPAYAVEYDFAPPTQLFPSLESKVVERLFLAGQINGTSGYEEAAAQGIIAGINAAQKVRGEPPLVLGRHESYIGVLLDELVTKGTKEPFRMFTSRAEHRLLLNHGSAELRLSKHANRLGLIPPRRWEAICAKAERISYWVDWLEGNRREGVAWADLIRQGSQPTLPDELMSSSPEICSEVDYQVRYRGYIERELRLVQRLAEVENVIVPYGFDFRGLPGLKRESASKLDAIRPRNLGQASRISGVTPADISILMISLARRRGDSG